VLGPEPAIPLSAVGGQTEKMSEKERKNLKDRDWIKQDREWQREKVRRNERKRERGQKRHKEGKREGERNDENRFYYFKISILVPLFEGLYSSHSS